MPILAVVANPMEALLKNWGFDYARFHQKRAVFVRPRLVDPRWLTNEPSKVTIDDASKLDVPAIAEFLAPFMARGEVLPRKPRDMAHLLRNGFVAKANGHMVGFVTLEIYSEKLAEIQ